MSGRFFAMPFLVAVMVVAPSFSTAGAHGLPARLLAL